MKSIIDKAVEVLMHDGVIVYPTDTIYGLGGDALSEEAVLKVFEAKGREYHKAISIAVSDPDMIGAVAHIDEMAEAFISTFLPGPVTIILKARPIIPRMLIAGTGRVGIRYPAHDVALDIISQFDSPITATSANLSGGPDPVTVQDCLVPHDLAVDVGKLSGIPSTVIDLVDKEILRPGTEFERVARLLAEWS